MKNLSIIIATIILPLITSLSCSEDIEKYKCNLEFFRYDYNEKVYLEISPYELWISIDSISENESREILKQYESIDLSEMEYEPPFIKLKLIGISDCVQIINLSENLLLNPQVKYVHFLFRSYKDPVFYPYDYTFTIKPKQDTKFSQIDSLLTITKTRIIRENSRSNNYDIIVDKYSSGNALEMSVYFYETGLFEYSIPNSYGYYCDE
jgi:hypothetical protein